MMTLSSKQRGIRATATALFVALSLLNPICAAETPAKSWLSIWDAIKQPAGDGFYVRNTTARLFNPANPADPAAPTAHVTITYFQHDCWGPVAVNESQVIPPGQHGSFSTLFAGYPVSLYGTGCLWIKSDAPIVPMNARVEEAEWVIENDFWRTALVPATRWTSYWEHSVALGGPAYGGIRTSGWVMNPARQLSRTEPLPSAHVTVSYYKGACGTGTLWKQESFTLGPGQFALYYSDLPSFDDNAGSGCLFIASDQPVVPLYGELRNAQQSVASAAIGFQPVSWNPPGGQP